MNEFEEIENNLYSLLDDIKKRKDFSEFEKLSIENTQASLFLLRKLDGLQESIKLLREELRLCKKSDEDMINRLLKCNFLIIGLSIGVLWTFGF